MLERAPWERLPASAPDLFPRLRQLGAAEVRVRIPAPMGPGARVPIPATSFTLQGRLRVEPAVERFAVLLPGWSDGDFAWFARRAGHGAPAAPAYWQVALEYRPAGRPALVLYLTAPLEALHIQVRPAPHPDS